MDWKDLLTAGDLAIYETACDSIQRSEDRACDKLAALFVRQMERLAAVHELDAIAKHSDGLQKADEYIDAKRMLFNATHGGKIESAGWQRACERLLSIIEDAGRTAPLMSTTVPQPEHVHGPECNHGPDEDEIETIQRKLRKAADRLKAAGMLAADAIDDMDEFDFVGR